MKISNFFKSLAANKRGSKKETKTKYFETQVTISEITDAILSSINIFIDNPTFDNDQIVSAIQNVVGDTQLAEALFFFIPEAYLRMTIKQVEYASYFTVCKKTNHFIEYELSNEDIYSVVTDVCNSQVDTLNRNPVSILRFNSTFEALNNAMHAGIDPKNIKLSPTVLIDRS